MSVELVIVEWTDCLADGDWVGLNEVQSNLPIIITIGFLIKETKEAICIAASLGIDDDIQDVGNVWTIPKTVIVSRRKLAIPAYIRKKLLNFK